MAGGRAASGPSFAKVPKPMEPPSAGKLLAAARARPPAGIPAAPAASVLKRPSAAPAEAPASKKGKGGGVAAAAAAAELEEKPAGMKGKGGKPEGEVAAAAAQNEPGAWNMEEGGVKDGVITKGRYKGKPDPDVWKAAHAAVLAELPQEAQPPNHPHGQYSYTLPLVLGRYNLVVRVEVLIRTRGFRVSHPPMTKEEAPFVAWGTDPAEAWALVKRKALEKAEALRDAKQSPDGGKPKKAASKA